MQCLPCYLPLLPVCCCGCLAGGARLLLFWLTQEREQLLAEVTAERRRQADEVAATNRAADEARANLLELKGRVTEYEAAAAAALKQAREESARAVAVREGLKAEQQQLTATKEELEVSSYCKSNCHRFQQANPACTLLARLPPDGTDGCLSA